VSNLPIPVSSSELLAADRATRAAAAAAERWLDNHRRRSSRAMSEPELDELLREALAAISRLLDADAVSLLLANDDGTELVGRAAYGLDREVDLDVSVPAGAGLSGPVLSTRMPRFVDDLREVEVRSDVLRNSGLRSYLGVPVATAERVFGVLHAGRRRVAPFGPDDAAMLAHFAEPLAVAIERVRLFGAERAARKEAEEAIAASRQAIERIRGLQGITAALAGAPTVEDIGKIIIEHAAAGATDEGERAIWMLRGSHLRLLAGLGESARFPEIPLDDSMPASLALDEGAPLFVETEAELTARWPALLDLPTKAFCALPLIVEGRRLGLLAIGFRGDHPFPPDEREYLTAIAEQAALALARAESQAALAEARQEAEERREQLDFLAEASDQLSRSLDLDVTLETVAVLAVPRLTDRCALYLLEGTEIDRRVIGPTFTDDEWELFLAGELNVSATGGVGAVIRTGTPQYIRDLDDQMLAAAVRNPGALDLLTRVGFGGVLIQPLRARGHTLGALAFVNRRGRPMDEDTVALAGELAARAALAIDNARLYTEASHVSHRLVESLLPSRLPSVPGLDMAVAYEPASSDIGVGGDFYDVITIDADTVLVTVGDVQGKGVEAAAVTGIARTTIKSATLFETDPAPLLAHLNATLIGHIIDRAESAEHPWDDARLCTAVVVRLDRNGRGWWATTASAGHPLPWLRHADGTLEAACEPGMMLGVDPEASYATTTVELAPGASLVLFTDGISECPADGGPLGTDGIATVLREAAGPAAETTARIAALATGSSGAFDDVVVLTVRADPAP